MHTQQSLVSAGDLARWLPTGCIEFLGRIDNQVCILLAFITASSLAYNVQTSLTRCRSAQVKLRGFRIELGEIESAMADMPGVALAVALVLTSTSGSQQLVGYVTPQSVDPATVIAALKARLPAHFVPLLVVPLARMPLLPNEKVDRKALASEEYAPDWSAAAEADEYVAPRSKLEAAVQAMWREVLGLEQVSVESDFFRIGGNSIMANKVTSRLRAALDTPLSGGALFQHPTIAALSRHLSGLGVSEPGGGSQMVPRAAFDAAALAAGVPASSMQEQLLRSELDPLMYMEVLLMERLRGPLDVEAMVGAWETLVMHQPALRTRFQDEGDRMLQARLPPFGHLPAQYTLVYLCIFFTSADLHVSVRAECSRAFFATHQRVGDAQYTVLPPAQFDGRKHTQELVDVQQHIHTSDLLLGQLAMVAMGMPGRLWSPVWWSTAA